MNTRQQHIPCFFLKFFFLHPKMMYIPQTQTKKHQISHTSPKPNPNPPHHPISSSI